MSENSEEILKEIEETRESLAEKVDTLSGQLKRGADHAKKKGMAVAGIALATIAGILTLKRMRKR